MATHLEPVAAAAALADEHELVRRAQAGDLSAFEVIVQRYEHRIYRLVLRMMGNSADTEDVLQETFLKVFSKLKQFQEQSRLYTWMVRIAVNEALMKLRKRRGNVISLDAEVASEEGPMVREIEDSRPNPEAQLQTTELGDLLQSSLEALPLGYRMVFQLRDIEELSTAETAEALGLSEAAVKSRLLRARLQLHKRLGRHLRMEGA
ncbi:MAG TPA: sigma-70 family RNA polymerase sigma factor [Terriglobales bacterium]|jgi:RNA polymerase sigma-70 factor (ECF subfamily)